MLVSQMFGVFVEKYGCNVDLCQKGKIVELVCGYGGVVGVFKVMGVIDMGFDEQELQFFVDLWR